MKRRGLSEREKLFVAGKVRGLSSTEAAKVAGYSARSAYNQGCRLMKRDEVLAALDAGTEKVLEKAEMDAAEVLRELSLMGRARLVDAFTDTWELKSKDELPEALRAAITTAKRRVDKDGNVSVEVRLDSKFAAITKMGEKHALFRQKVDVEISEKPVAPKEVTPEEWAKLSVLRHQVRKPGGSDGK